MVRDAHRPGSIKTVTYFWHARTRHIHVALSLTPPLLSVAILHLRPPPSPPASSPLPLPLANCAPIDCRSSPEPAVARGASPEPPVPGTWFPATSAASGAPSMVSVDEQTPPADTADSVAAARGGPSGQWEAPRAATSVLGMPNPFGAGMAGGSGQGAQNASDQAEPPQPRPPEAWAKPSSWHMPPQGSIFGSPVWEAPGAHAVPQKGASGAQTTKEPGAGGGSWNAGPWFRGVGAGPAEDTGQARRPGAEAAGTHPDAMPNYTGSIGGSGRVFAAPSSEEASEASVRAREESIFGDIQNTTESFQVKLNLGDRVRWRKGGSKRRGPGRSKSAAGACLQMCLMEGRAETADSP